MYFSLQNITLTNFRGIKSTLRLDFSNLLPGLYFIRGRNEIEPRLGSNGCGKSTLFIDSIYWALTNKVARSQRPGADIENWESLKKTVSVGFGFKLDNEFELIERSRNPITLKHNDEIIEQKELDSLLPLTDSALRRSILIDQFGEMFLSLGPEQKSRLFSETLNLDVWLSAAEKAGQEVTSCEKIIIKKEQIISGIKGSLSEARDLFEAAEKAEANFQKEIKIVCAEKRLVLAEALAQAQEADKALSQARQALSKMSSAENGKNKSNNLKVLLRQREKALIETKSLVGNIKSEISRLESEIKKYNLDSKVCLECGQKVSNQHIIEKKKDLVEKQSRAKDRLKNSELSEKGAQQIYDSVNKDLEGLEKELSDYNNCQSRVVLHEESTGYKYRYVDQLNKEIEELENKKNPFTKQCNDLESRITELLDQRDALKEETDSLYRKLEIYKFWQKGFKEIRLDQIDSTLLELEMSANKHAESLGLENWEMKFVTERENKKGTISHGFSVFLYPPNQTEPISFESYSGGETQRLQLAATFGLAEVLLARSGIETDFEILDEPTVHLSPEGVDDLLACLHDRAIDLNRRIFIIDHHALDRGAFDNVFTVVKSNKGVYIEDDGLLTKTKQRERVKL